MLLERDNFEESQILSQCDRMARIFFQYLAISKNENLPNGIIKIAKADSKFCPRLLKRTIKLAKIIILPKLVTLVPAQETLIVER